MSQHKMEILAADEGNFFAELFEEVPTACKHTVLPDPLLNNLSVKSLTIGENTRKPYKGNLCRFRALALPLQGSERLEREKSKLFNLIL